MTGLLLLLGLLAVSAHSAHAQSRLHLEPPSDVAPLELDGLPAVVELSRGDVIVLDSRARLVHLVNWSRSSVVQLGRQGEGPGEYRLPSQLMVGTGDTVFAIDARLRRWLVMKGGRLSGQLPIEATSTLVLYDSRVLGVDSTASVLSVVPRPSARGSSLASGFGRTIDSDSLLLVRSKIGRARVDTLMPIRGRSRGTRQIQRRVGSTEYNFRLSNPFGVEDQAWMFADGWIAVVRTEPYSITWIDRNGAVVTEKVLPTRPVATTKEEMQFAIRNDWPQMPSPRPRVDEYVGWPTHVPPFLNDALIPLPDGRIAVERTVTARSSVRQYEVIDRTGRVVRTLTVPLDHRIVGFGRQFVYVANEVESGVFRVGRHVMPAL